MPPRISTLRIERFRSLPELRLEGLGRVNLITGRNNTGKSSVLEALRILAFEGSPAVLSSILRLREEDLAGPEEPLAAADFGGFGQFTALFPGFPRFSEIREPVVFAADSTDLSVELTISPGFFSEEPTQDGGRKLVSKSLSLSGAEDLVPALVIKSANGGRIITFDSLRRMGLRGAGYSRPDILEQPLVPCVFVSPFGGEWTAALGALWDRIALQDEEKHVVEALRIIVEDVEAVSMVGGESSRQGRTAIFRSRGFERPVPLRSFGDGLNRLFGIVLSLVNAKDGLLLIDEFENGMHHSVQFEVWRAIFRLAGRLNVQVFATSHSWDAIEAFQKAAAEHSAEGLLIRLSRKGDAVIPTLFREEELAVATREHIEVR